MTKLIDRIAAKLGYERPQPVVTEIVIFASAEEARHCGFRNGGHPEMPHVQAWWPGLGLRGLAMRPIQRVTIPERMLTHQTEEGGLAAILRARQRVFGDRAVWLVLR